MPMIGSIDNMHAHAAIQSQPPSTLDAVDYGVGPHYHGTPDLAPHTEQSPVAPVPLLTDCVTYLAKISDHTDVFAPVLLRPTGVYGRSSSYYRGFFGIAAKSVNSPDILMCCRFGGLGGYAIEVQRLPKPFAVIPPPGGARCSPAFSSDAPTYRGPPTNAVLLTESPRVLVEGLVAARRDVGHLALDVPAPGVRRNGNIGFGAVVDVLRVRTATIVRFEPLGFAKIHGSFVHPKTASIALFSVVKMASKAAAKAVSTVGNAVSISQGIWEGIRRVMALDKNRSNGVPLNPYFRYPTPGSVDPLAYDDPVTVPAGDIAGNPYWKRDSRRNYPRLSVVNQADAVALLTVGNAVAPKTELIGAAGTQAIVAATEAGQTKGLSAHLETTSPTDAAKDLFVNGLPPTPSGQSLSSGSWDVHKYTLDEEQSYTDESSYPCRSFQ
ncbi:hypothetical protein SPI_06150 [Niveomyces insectorum RCEF 264]|uniref:NADH-ubiquinone oxidoreductase n=1 Tax=Niveomyces insectorum RCEF 264 TaxID=1081102 RepID=A0A167RUD6_9HYPO|nr:hypothetical protein SPI_06150 [Niveomyces insectorum RCEF 264]